MTKHLVIGSEIRVSRACRTLSLLILLTRSLRTLYTRQRVTYVSHRPIIRDTLVVMFARPYVCSACRKSTVFGVLRQPRNQHLHASPPLGLPRRKDFFSSNAYLKQERSQGDSEAAQSELETQKQRRKASRTPATKTSLRRVAVEAQRSRDGILSKAQLSEKGLYKTKVAKLISCEVLVYGADSLKRS